MKRSLLAVAAVLALAVAGCGGGSDDNSGAAAPPATGAQPAPSGSAAGTGNTVDIHNFAFTPDTVSIAPGSAVTWDFQDAIEHTVVADDNSFSSKPLGNGQTFEHAFTAPGSVPYHCSIHPFMKGTVTVK